MLFVKFADDARTHGKTAQKAHNDRVGTVSGSAVYTVQERMEQAHKALRQIHADHDSGEDHKGQEGGHHFRKPERQTSGGIFQGQRRIAEHQEDQIEGQRRKQELVQGILLFHGGFLVRECLFHLYSAACDFINRWNRVVCDGVASGTVCVASAIRRGI